MFSMPALSVAQLRSSEFFKNSSEIPQKTYLVSSCPFNEAVNVMGSKDREFFKKHLFYLNYLERKGKGGGKPLGSKKKIAAVSIEGHHSGCRMLCNRSLQSLVA